MSRLLTRRYVYDSAQRVLHWWIGLTTILLIVTGLLGSNLEPGSRRAYLWDLHMLTGYALVVGSVGRLIWGMLGPKHARFSSLFHMRTLLTWLKNLRSRPIESADGAFGHHPQAAISYVGFYGLIFVMCGSGLSLAGMLHGVGPLARDTMDDLTKLDVIHEFHEIGMWCIAAFIVMHIVALIWHEKLDQIPVAQSMVSGYQYRTPKEHHHETLDLP